MRIIFKNTSTTMDTIRSKNRLVFPNKQAGISIIEVIIAAGILGVTLFFSMNLFSTKTQIMSKNTAAQGVRGMEQAALSLIEIAGMEAFRKGCGSKTNIESVINNKADFPLQLVNLKSNELSNLPADVNKRCKKNNFLSITNKSFYVCKKLTGSKFLDKKLLIIEGRYFFKNFPNFNDYSNCESSDYKSGYENGKLYGGQFYYNLITAPKITKGRKLAMTTKRRSKYMRADSDVCETYEIQVNKKSKEEARTLCFND